MSVLSRIFTRKPDPREALRPLWHAVVATSREREWYADCGAQDSIDGRVDMIVLVLCLVILRMEAGERLGPRTALLTELFVADMDRQLRDTGVGDLMVGKNIGKLMEALGGRLGALRKTLANNDEKALADVLRRNVALADESSLAHFAARTRTLNDELTAMPDDALLRGEVRP